MTDSRGRLSAARRGYNATHRAIRLRFEPLVRSGAATCWRCGLAIAPRQQWDLGHRDGSKTDYMGPEHALARDCPAGGNRATKRLDRRTDPAPRRAGWWRS